MRARELIGEARLRSGRGDLQGAREILAKLLRAVPRHLEGQLLLGDLLLRLGTLGEASRHFEVVLAIDPLNVPALRGALQTYRGPGHPARTERMRQLLNALGSTEPTFEKGTSPELVVARAEALWASGRHAEAERALNAIDPPWARAQLILADIAIQRGEERQGVARLHAARGLDPSLLVARELFAPPGLYAEYLQNDLEIEPESPIQITSVQPFLAVEETSGALGEVEATSNSIPMTVDSRGQVELILTSRSGLLAHYGESLPHIEEGLSTLAAAIRSSGLEAAVVYVDDERSLRPWGLTPVDPSHPERVRALIQAIEERLQSQALRADYLLLVGGDEILPFFRLPNTTEDQDELVLSDAPYAARGPNYLLPERAVGRLPAPAGHARFLVEALERAAQAHRSSQKGARLLAALRQRGRGLGVTAQIWEEAARAVFAPLGGGKALQVSPPATDQEFLERHSRLPPFAYFNLHGVRGGPYWYGHQRRPQDGETLFPIALTPHNLAWLEVPAGVVFSEACYGAEVIGRSPQDSIALGFLAAGIRALVGSTAMAYGSLSAPLSGADLLARLFWLGLLEGHRVGETLRRAKLGLIEEMGQRQGYLDAEDQKTLLSFVLYGDPSLPGPSPSRAMKKRAEEVACPAVVCSRRNGDKALPQEEIQQQVRAYLADRVPRMVDRLEASALNWCSGDCGCQACPLRGSTVSAAPREARWVFTASLQEPLPVAGELPQVVRVTTDPRGSILKVAFSR